MNLTKEFSIKKGDVVTIVGSGGKTTLLYKLGNELKNNKVLLTTTTKMFKPNKEDVDYFQKKIDIKGNGRYFLYSEIKGEKVSADLDLIKGEINKFDYSIIEGDGSKRKKIKGWNDLEPVVLEETTKTIGVIPINAIGISIDEDNIHRLELFKEIIKDKKAKKISVNEIIDIVKDKNGLFKNSSLKKILFINCVESLGDLEYSKEIKDRLKDYDIKVVIGSLKEDLIYK